MTKAQISYIQRRNKDMKKRYTRIIAMAAAFMLSAVMLAGCGDKAVIGGADAATDIVIESEGSETESSSSEVSESEVSLEPMGETEEAAEEESYIDMQPVAKWGYIASIDEEEHRINFSSNEYVVDEDGNYSDTVTEIVLNVPESTPVLDAKTLLPVALSDIDTSAPVYVWTSMAMTMSLPPQTTAQVIIVNVPEDASAPMYVIAKDVEKTDDGIIITDQDGVKWRADADTQVSPYLTRNIVTLEDVAVGTRCIVSQDSETTTSGTEKAEGADAYAAKLLLFAD